MANLFIPTKIKVGFQQRSETFTGKLAYVIYYDEKGKIRKEKSWESWRDKNIEAVEFDNVPMNGFIFNKGIQRTSEWFGSGRTVFRVYAPHDFEFEINADNLLNLLMHSDVSKREILEQCIFAWQGTELILLPVNSVEYQQSIAYTEKQSLKVSTKELIKGCQYHQKKSSEILTYLGQFDWYDWKYDSGKRYSRNQEVDPYRHKKVGKKHVFVDSCGKIGTYGTSVLSSIVNDEVVANYAELVDKFYSTYHSQPITNIKIAGKTKYDNDREWRSYPYMFKYDPTTKTLIHIRAEHSYKWDHKSNKRWYEFEDAKFIQHKVTVDFEDGVTTTIPEKGKTYSYSSYITDIWSPINLHVQLRDAAIARGFDYTNIDVRQYVLLMTDLGYGQPVFELQNGTNFDYKTRYYSYYY